MEAGIIGGNQREIPFAKRRKAAYTPIDRPAYQLDLFARENRTVAMNSSIKVHEHLKDWELAFDSVTKMHFIERSWAGWLALYSCAVLIAAKIFFQSVSSKLSCKYGQRRILAWYVLHT